MRKEDQLEHLEKDIGKNIDDGHNPFELLPTLMHGDGKDGSILDHDDGP